MREMRRNVFWKSLAKYSMILILTEKFSSFLRGVVNVIFIDVPIDFSNALLNMIAEYFFLCFCKGIEARKNYWICIALQYGFNFFSDAALQHPFICDTFLE